MNTYKQLIAELEKQLDINISIFYDTNEMLVYNQQKTRIYKLPKKLNESWIINKIELFNENSYRSLHSLFSKLDIKGLTYTASYGIGYSCLFANDEVFKRDTKIIEDKLNALGIEFQAKFSDARYCLRYIISTKKDNLEKIKSISTKG